MNVVSILQDICLMSVLILIAKVIRVKIKVIQNLYIPAALIAGFLGLVLGKQFLNVVPFSGAISSYAGILIAILFGSLFLGNNKGSSFSNMFKTVGDTFLVNAASEIAQFGIFIFLGCTLLPIVFDSVGSWFGIMLPAGFVGGHGTAAIGGVFSEAGIEDATSIGQTFATIGLLAGIILGVCLINIGVRKGYLELITDFKNLPQDMLTGLIPIKQRRPFGDNTINSMSMDSLTWHLSLILTAVGGAYIVNGFLKVLCPHMSFPIYGLALLCSILLSFVLRVCSLDEYVDKNTITHIGSCATDYLVGFGVASINVSVVVKYIIPIVVVSVLGLLFVVIWFFIISPRFFRTYWFERALYIFGMSTGVLATGVILLRIADPEFKSGVLEDFGFAWIFLSIIDMVLVSFSPMFVLSDMGVGYSLVLVLVSAICLIMCKVFFGKGKVYAK